MVVQFCSAVVEVVEGLLYLEEEAVDLTFQVGVVVPCLALMRLVVVEGVHHDLMLLGKVERAVLDLTY